MWKMYDDIMMFECDECAGLLAPPPQFLIPPPPRPPSLGEYSHTQPNCNEEELALTQQKQQWDSDMCEAMPIFDASLYSSQSLATSAMIAVFSLLLVLVVLISSLFVWKNKRKVQNLLPCKTTTRGVPHHSHISGALPPLGGSTYEDPDGQLAHHRPLVMRHHHHHHHNVEMLHGKSIHYPSGYPMTRSPPFLVSSSPGPDPYRSNDNVYEELGPGRADSDGESEPALQSDDDFAEDELSLPGESNYNKATQITCPADSAAVSTIYHERITPSAHTTAPTAATAVPERHSVMSSSSSTAHDVSTATVASSSTGGSSTNNNNNNGSEATGTNSRTGPSGLLSGMLRHTTGRSKFHSTQRNNRRGMSTATPQDELNTSMSTADIAPLYDNGSNMMSLGYLPHQQPQPVHVAAAHPSYHHSLRQLHHNINNSNNNNARSTAPQFYNTLETEVERRNRINEQRSQAPPVSTIYRERIHYPGSGRYPQAYYSTNSANGLLSAAMRARTNPRSTDRRHYRIAAPVTPIEPAYGYAEPVFNQNYFYDTCCPQESITSGNSVGMQQGSLGYTAYMVPDYTTAGRSLISSSSTSSTGYHPGTQLYARGDISFGSDSGYSNHTPASSIGRHDYDITDSFNASTSNSTQPKVPSKLSSALSFGWNRRKNSTPSAPTTLNVMHTANTASTNTIGKNPTSASSSLGSSTDATSPNNNSACSTVTSQLENSSNASSLQSPPAQNNNQAAQA